MKYTKKFLGESNAYSPAGAPLFEFGILDNIEYFIPYSIKSMDLEKDRFSLTVWFVNYGKLTYIKQMTVDNNSLNDRGIDYYVNYLIDFYLK